MPAAKQLTADAFFVLQITLALISGGSEFLRLLTTSQGVNVSWLAKLAHLPGDQPGPDHPGPP